MRHLLVAPHLPPLGEERDGQAIYLHRLLAALGRRGAQDTTVVALRVGKQGAADEGPGYRVRRVDPPHGLDTIFDLYEPDRMRPALAALTRAALEEAQQLGPDSAAWCHGYECGEAAAQLGAMGLPVVAVVHYLVAQESVHDLAVADDPVRRVAFDSPLATAVGTLWPRAWRSVLVRQCARNAHLAQHLPLPSVVANQLEKLQLERQLLLSSSSILAVGANFADSIALHYPCTRERTDWAIAGAPLAQQVQPWWPHPDRPGALRVAMVGRPTGQKGWDYAAEAFALLESSHPEVSKGVDLVAAGGLGHWGGPYSSYSERVAKDMAGLQKVTFENVGEVSHDRVLSLLEAADLLLFPSVFEPLGLVILEAMSRGCMVLSSDADGPSDLLRTPWGIRVPFGAPRQRAAALATALAEIASLDHREVARRGALARDAAAVYSWDDCAQEHLKAVDRACLATGAPPD